MSQTSAETELEQLCFYATNILDITDADVVLHRLKCVGIKQHACPHQLFKSMVVVQHIDLQNSGTHYGYRTFFLCDTCIAARANPVKK